jgi:uncharacterized protein (TIGR00159 family)
MMIMDILGFLHLGFADIIDIIVVALILYVAFRWLRGSSAVNIFIAILMLFVIRIIAVALNMKLLSALLDTIIDVGAIALIVIFQPEIRQFLSRVGRSTGFTGEKRNLLARLLGRSANALDDEAAKELSRACFEMAEQKTGALIVIRHKNPLQDIIDSGDVLDAEIRCSLIENIFFKNSPLHDGAVILGGNRILAARCTLPITDRTDIPAKYGMRHKSAVGISERSDADVVVVSEQRGTVCFVRDGIITPVESRNQLKLLLEPPKQEK